MHCFYRYHPVWYACVLRRPALHRKYEVTNFPQGMQVVVYCGDPKTYSIDQIGTGATGALITFEKIE